MDTEQINESFETAANFTAQAKLTSNNKLLHYKINIFLHPGVRVVMSQNDIQKWRQQNIADFQTPLPLSPHICQVVFYLYKITIHISAEPPVWKSYMYDSWSEHSRD